MNRLGHIISAGLIAALVALPAFAQDEAPAETDPLEPAITLADRLPDLEQRLEALVPEEPAGYVLLAEEVAAMAAGETDLDLARRLAVLGHELARVQGDRGPLRATACVLLADLARLSDQRRWLLAIAARAGDEAAEARLARPGPEASAELVDRAADAFHALMRGDGPLAEDLLEDDEVSGVIVRYADLIEPGRTLGSTRSLRVEADQWPCRQCTGRRIVRGPNGTFRFCDTCGGTRGWEPGPEFRLGVIRFESRLLSGGFASWSAQFASDFGRPLDDPDPTLIPRRLGIDPTLTVYRAGTWRSPPEQDG